jgi:hypothetical protein
LGMDTSHKSQRIGMDWIGMERQRNNVLRPTARHWMRGKQSNERYTHMLHTEFFECCVKMCWKFAKNV